MEFRYNCARNGRRPAAVWRHSSYASYFHDSVKTTSFLPEYRSVESRISRFYYQMFGESKAWINYILAVDNVSLYQWLDFNLQNPDNRATAAELLNHDFITNSKPAAILLGMINEARDIRENLQNGIYPAKLAAPADNNNFQVTVKMIVWLPFNCT